MRIGSSPAEASVKFQSDTTIARPILVKHHSDIKILSYSAEH